MKTFVVGFLSFFENEILMEKIKAESGIEAIRKCSFLKNYELPEDTSIEGINSILFDSDATISVIEV